MHFLKHFTVWGLCAIMLGTQPSIAYMAEVSTRETATYESDAQAGSGKERSAEGDTRKQSAEDSSSGDKDKPDSSEESSSESSSESSESSESSPEDSSGEDSSQATDDSSETDSSTESSEESSTTDTSSTTEESGTTESTTEEAAAETSASAAQSSTAASKKDDASADKTDTSASPEEDSKSSKRKKDAVIIDKEVKKLDDSIISEEESAEKDEDPEAVIPKIYGTAQITTRDDAEYMGDFVYFNQTDSIWNQNGYRIASAGCGPTSMAVVISSLTKKWVTPVDATVWAYEHGYYSSAGSAHALIPAMAEAYGLKCKGVGTDYEAIRTALKKGRPVVALMGLGYFTRRGHFMVLIGIDDEDNVTVADVGSRTRSAYKYALSDIISQSKSASAGGPFWVISKPQRKKKKVTYASPQNDYVIHVKEDGREKSIAFQLGDQVSYQGQEGIIIRFENRKAYITGADGHAMKAADGDRAIPLSDLQIVKRADGMIYTAMAARNAADKDTAGNTADGNTSANGNAAARDTADNHSADSGNAAAKDATANHSAAAKDSADNSQK